MLLLSATMAASAQKISITTSSGQKIEIACDGVLPNQIIVANDSVILKMDNKEMAEAKEENPDASAEEQADSVDTFVPVEKAEATQAEKDTTSAGSGASLVATIANSIAEELSPEYAQFNQEHLGYHPGTERELAKQIAKSSGVNENIVEAVDLAATLFSGIRFTRDSTFVPDYSLRKERKSLRTYDIVELSGSFGKNIDNFSQETAEQIDRGDYDIGIENNNQYGGGIKYSHVYINGSEDEEGNWQPNPLGFGWSWGGLVSYKYEKDQGSYLSFMGKAGIQIGNDIAVGLDALVGYGVTPFNSFFSNGVNYAVIGKSVFGFKYGVELWGSLNFSKNTYTALYGRYIRSIRPSSDALNFDGWVLMYEDFDPSDWSVGLAIGYKFGAFEPLKQEKRLQASLSAGYMFTGRKSMTLTAELEKITQVSKSTTLSYGLAGEKQLKDNSMSLLLSAGFKVKQPYSPFFWGVKLYGGLGQYGVLLKGKKDGDDVSDFTKKLCGRGYLQLSTGWSIGKLHEVFASFLGGYHAGKKTTVENYDNFVSENLSGIDLGMKLGYKLTF